MNRIVVFGDLHADMGDFYKRISHTKVDAGDYVIVCGDFGFIWNGTWKKNLHKIGRITKATVIVCLGNHENYNKIETFPFEYEESIECSVRKPARNVWILPMYGVFKLLGHKFFFCAGARSHDKDWRVADVSWWHQEEPTADDMFEANRIFNDNKDTIEYMISHDCGSYELGQLRLGYNNDFAYTEWGYLLPKFMDSWFETLYYDCPQFKCHYFGHHHVDNEIVGGKAMCLYKEVKEIH